MGDKRREAWENSYSRRYTGDRMDEDNNWRHQPLQPDPRLQVNVNMADAEYGNGSDRRDSDRRDSDRRESERRDNDRRESHRRDSDRRNSDRGEPLRRGSLQEFRSDRRPTSGNVSPQSAAMSVSTAGQARSGEGTPTTPVAQPWSAGRPPTRAAGDVETSMSTTGKDSLLTYLSRFTETVTKAAVTSTEYQTAKDALARQEKESNRWNAHHDTFSLLAQEQEKLTADLKATCKFLGSKVKEREAVRGDAINTLANVIITAASGRLSQIEDSKKIQTLEKDLSASKSELSDLQKDVQSLRSAVTSIQTGGQRVDAIELKQEGLIKSVADIASDWKPVIMEKVKDFSEQLNGLHTTAATLQIKSLQVTKSEESITQSLNELREQVKKAEKAKDFATVIEFNILADQVTNIHDELANLKKVKTEVDELNAKHKTLDLAHQDLMKEVIGDKAADNPGILEVCDNLMKEMTVRVSHLESRDPEAVKNSIPGFNHVEIEAELKKLVVDVEDVKENQIVKEEATSVEIEDLRNDISQLRENYDTIKNVTRSTQSDLTRMRDQLSKLPTPSKVAQQHSDADLVDLNSGQSDTNKFQQGGYSDLKQALIGCEETIVDLQKRFDNLSTQSLAQNMVHQMQEMYPYPATVQRDLHDLREAYLKIKGNITHLENRERDLDVYCHTLANQITTLKARNNDPPPNSLPPESNSSQLTALDIQVKSISQNITTNFRPQLDAVQKQSNANAKDIEDLTTGLQTAQTDYEARLNASETAISTLRDAVSDVEDSTVTGLARATNETAITYKHIWHIDNWLAKKLEYPSFVPPEAAVAAEETGDDPRSSTARARLEPSADEPVAQRSVTLGGVPSSGDELLAQSSITSKILVPKKKRDHREVSNSDSDTDREPAKKKTAT